jgi:hypothetical protein
MDKSIIRRHCMKLRKDGRVSRVAEWTVSHSKGGGTASCMSISSPIDVNIRIVNEPRRLLYDKRNWANHIQSCFVDRGELTQNRQSKLHLLTIPTCQSLRYPHIHYNRSVEKILDYIALFRIIKFNVGINQATVYNMKTCNK